MYEGKFNLGNTIVDILLIKNPLQKEIIKITNSVEIYWKGNLVETNEDFKKAMLDLKDGLLGKLK